jgi:4'-phosphopantetheinyl transferase EntD
VLADLFPTVVASAELFSDPPGVVLFDSEIASLSGAVTARRLEFGTVRHCARLALGELGYPPVPLLRGPAGETQWPPGVVGSMTHCHGYRAAAVARAADVSGLGIDAEPHEPLPEDVLSVVALGQEQIHLEQLRAADDSVCWDRVLFSCKESVYKAWFPLTRRWLGYEDVSVTIDPGGAFSAYILVAGATPDEERLRSLTGRWIVRNDLILTAISVPKGAKDL